MTNTSPQADSRIDHGRVLIVVQNLPVPYDRRVWLEATTLTKAGYDVTVICPATEAYPEEKERLEGVDIRRFKIPVDPRGPAGYAVEFGVSLAKVTRIALSLRKEAPFDILHACNPPEIYWILARLLRRLDNTSFIFDHHDLSPEMFKAKFEKPNSALYRILRWLERRTYNTADHVIVTNESYRRITTQRTGFDTAAVTTVRSGPSTARFQMMPADASLSQGCKFLLVYLGEIGEQDGVENLIEAMAVLRDRRDDIHCLLIGDGPNLETIKTLAVELDVEKSITFAGRVSDDLELSRMLSSGTIGLVPDPNSEWSRFSTMNKVMEYMFFGMPVAAFDLVETRFTAQDTALYATPDDVADFVRIIEQFLDDPLMREAMGQRARERLLADLSWERSVGPLTDAYKTVMTDRC